MTHLKSTLSLLKEELRAIDNQTHQLLMQQPNTNGIISNGTYKYDFALSFAGDERPVAEQLYNLLKNESRVFYDFANETEPSILGT